MQDSSALSIPILEIIPHSGQMVFLDQVVAYGYDFIECRVLTSSPLIPRDPSGKIPVWFGIEFMAQTVAAYAGLHARLAKKEVVLGFLLGTRLLECTADSFHPQQQLLCHAHMLLIENNLGIFDCKLSDENTGKLLSQGQIRVFSPENVATYLKGKNELTS